LVSTSTCEGYGIEGQFRGKNGSGHKKPKTMLGFVSSTKMKGKNQHWHSLQLERKLGVWKQGVRGGECGKLLHSTAF